MDPLRLQLIWEDTLERLAQTHPSVTMELFFRDTELVLLSETDAVVQNYSDAYAASLRSAYTDSVQAALSHVIDRTVRVTFVSAEHGPVDLRALFPDLDAPLSASVAAPPAERIKQGNLHFGNFFNPRYTFENFIVGASNKFAHAACEAVAREGVNSGYNPLFIYGNSGLGKTHLLYAIINATLRRDPNVRIVYAKGDDFINEMIDALSKKTTAQFREKYRRADILLIDDIHFLAGKPSTQEEFFHTFNTLYEDGRQIVLTSDRPARDINPLEDRLRTRFESGLCADIQPPDYELRIAIMKDKSKTMQAKIPDEVFAFLAEHLKTNVRQMEGAIKKITSLAFLNQEPVTVEMATHCIADLVFGTEPDSVLVERIISAVSQKYGVTPEEIRGKKRTQNIVRPRNIAIHIIRRITELSLEDIGKEFDRNHTTIMNSLEVIEKEKQNSPLLDLEIEEMIKEIRD